MTETDVSRTRGAANSCGNYTHDRACQHDVRLFWRAIARTVACSFSRLPRSYRFMRSVLFAIATVVDAMAAVCCMCVWPRDLFTCNTCWFRSTVATHLLGGSGRALGIGLGLRRRGALQAERRAGNQVRSKGTLLESHNKPGHCRCRTGLSSLFLHLQPLY